VTNKSSVITWKLETNIYNYQPSFTFWRQYLQTTADKRTKLWSLQSLVIHCNQCQLCNHREPKFCNGVVSKSCHKVVHIQSIPLTKCTQGERITLLVIIQDPLQSFTITGKHSSLQQGSILDFFQTRQPGKYIRKDTCPDKILLAHSKLCNN